LKEVMIGPIDEHHIGMHNRCGRRQAPKPASDDHNPFASNCVH
jgi:hypothetical protein